MSQRKAPGNLMQNLVVEQRCSKIQGDWGRREHISGQVRVSAVIPALASSEKPHNPCADITFFN